MKIHKLGFEIISSNNIDGKKYLEKNEISLKINEVNNGSNDKDKLSISIDNLKDFALILDMSKNIKNKINYDDLFSELIKLLDTICKKIVLNDKDTIDIFNLFINSLVKRRNNNVSKCVKKITKDFTKLKDLQKIKIK